MKTHVWLSFCVLLAGCHSAAIAVERRSSGAVEEDHQFKPRKGTDGHYISFASHPFVNCIDPFVFETGHTHEDGPRRTPCSDSHKLTAFTGYTTDELEDGDVSWINPSSDERQEAGLKTLEDELGVAGLEWPTAAFSFAHFSDVQIREPEAKLTNAEASRKLDTLIGTFERNYDQEQYSKYVYAALVDTVNKEVARESESGTHISLVRPPPAFMIHTGDAVDAGLLSEFEDFLQHSNRLTIPWYQAIGNHDVLAFGNMRLLNATRAKEIQDLDLDLWTRVGGDEKCGLLESSIACTCTQVADLIRAEMLPKPDNRGVETLEKSDRRPSLAPMFLRRICILHEVENDRFVMNPAKTKNAANAFMKEHCVQNGDKGCLEHKLPAGQGTRQPQYPTIPGDRENMCATLGSTGETSKWHGFDLSPGFEPAALAQRPSLTSSEQLSQQLNVLDESSTTRGGYYCFEVEAVGLDTRRVWAIVLDTTTENGAYGDISGEQLNWLRRIFDKQVKDHDLVMLFGHHPLWDIYNLDKRNKLLGILGDEPGVIGYFAGHTHRPELRVVHPEKALPSNGKHHFWEMTAPSVISFPQQVRQITVKTMGKEVGFIEVLTFTPHGTGASAPKVDRAQAGAKKDKCAENPTICVDGEPRLLGRLTTYSRLFFRMPPLPASQTTR